MENKRRHYSIFWPILLIVVGIVLFLYLRPVKPQAAQAARVEAGTGAAAG